MENPFIVLLQIVRALESNSIDYVVVGSIASSIHGDFRASADIDIVADISVEQIDPFVSQLRNDFYIDDLAVRKAVTSRRSFNAIHLNAIFKIDIFLPADPLGRQQLVRREQHMLAPEQSERVWVATAEDTILAKLKWYRLGQHVSELQWRDVKGILATQGSRLDQDYLRSWAEQIGVLDLLQRAQNEI
jgi:hypothetical protein